MTALDGLPDRMPPRAASWIRISSITTADMTPDEKIDLIATAVEEYGIALALMTVHSAGEGLVRYAEVSGRVAVDQAGNPIIRWPR